MSNARDSFLDLEKHRLRLEDSISQLQKALQHWQTWDAEYEALKEEVEAVVDSDGDEAEELRRIHDEFEGELLTGKEIDEVFGGKASKTKEQIINVLERRIDYVTKNIENLQKQVETAENKHAAATIVSQPDATDEDGQPITDIVEQLDDDDNVISYRLNKAGDSIPRVQGMLEKAGITELPGSEPRMKEQVTESSAAPEKPRQEVRLLGASSQPTIPSTALEPSVKKTVSFSDDINSEEEPRPEISWRARRVEQIMNTAKEHEDLSKQAPIIPEGEDPEEAALRQQMLQYGMGEIGAVVAELELEEGDSDDSGFDYIDEGFDEDFDEDNDEDEDEYGRNGRVVTDKYRQRMLELEQKLGIASHPSQAPQAKTDEENSDDERIGRIMVNRGAGASSSTPKAKPSKSNIKDKLKSETEGKKGVRFASDLDIAAEDEAATPASKEKKKDTVDPLSDIVERSGPSKPTQSQPAKKASRFKKARGDTSSETVIPKGPLDMPTHFIDQDRPSAPSGPEGTTIADTLVERDSTSTAVAPDEFDGSIAYREVTDEYQKMRRKFIQRDGGFLKEDESPVQPVVDEDNEPPISRFKAARLSRQ
ncbi:hypothetical protein PT974_06132 [Cladobotryum mycophilum]|uniref:DUF3835 domain-containing protein n=1 Tax=Cladobotryum mycophilum TaxID=491253 RepID=A0ABR0SLE8_9HYPO